MSDPSPSSSAPRGATLAVFDFDGTLTVQDSFVAFIRWRTDGWRWILGLLRLAPEAALYLFTRDRGRLKGAAVRVFLRGIARDDLAREAEAFAARAAAGLLRPDALAAWEGHGAAGDHRVIVTASPEEVVRPFAERLQADTLIGSRLAWTPAGRVGGGLEGANCRGEEKVRRLRTRFGPDLEIGGAYGDTTGDREMLALARRGHMRVFTGRPSA